MKLFSLLIKPASAHCNLRCDYCFYFGRETLYPESTTHRMSEDILSRMISSYMTTEQPHFGFCWQGGEPLLMGVSFFRRIIQLQKKHGKNGSMVTNSIQTNATLLDRELAMFFHRYRFLVGISMDGPQAIHDRYRRYGNGTGSYREVRKGVDLLRSAGVSFNVLVLVHRMNVAKAREVYEHLLDQGCFFQQYIPCVEFDRDGALLPFSINGTQWGEFLCEIFDQWYPSHVGRISIRLFDSLLSRLLGEPTHDCHMSKNCNQYLVVEYNGDIYPCDFFVEKERRLGNVMSVGWEDVLASPAYRSFGRRKREWSHLCSRCKWLDYCAGDCPRFRVSPRGRPGGVSRLCDGWRLFYDHALPKLRRLARLVRNRRQENPFLLHLHEQIPTVPGRGGDLP
ncbi:MAG: anaerobic sulfatase maturase [Syntrophobacteraceae bacterium]|nr:anaerobic sulfatase maturase [Syntrophobacteraceae bacterium]